MHGSQSKSVLKSVFTRKGGEGKLTKIIEDDGEKEVFKKLNIDRSGPNESPFVLYYLDASTWLVLTTFRTILSMEGVVHKIQNTNIVDVGPALNTEFLKGISDKNEFSFLNIQDERRQYHMQVEAGRPYWGIYQVLRFIVSSNTRNKKAFD